MSAAEKFHSLSIEMDMLAAEVGTGGLKSWMLDNIVSIAVLAIGVLLIVASRQRQHGAMMEIVGGVIVGLVIVGMSFGTNAADIGKFFVDLLVSKSGS